MMCHIQTFPQSNSDDVHNEEWVPQTANETNVPLKHSLVDQSCQHEKLQHEFTLAGELPIDPTVTALMPSKSQENNLDLATYEPFKPKQIQREIRSTS